MSSSLIVTLIGMAVVFVAMSLFYLSMHVLTAVTREKTEHAEDLQQEQADGMASGVSASTRPAALRAAAVAVALARAEQESLAGSTEAYGFVTSSPWRDYYRQRQLNYSRGRLD